MIGKKSIKEQILSLKELQIIDGEIFSLNREKEAIPLEIKEMESKLEGKKIGIKQAEDDLKNLQVKLKEKDVTLQQKEDEIKKLDGQLSQLKTNKEYSTMLREIESIKADNSLIEEEMLKAMDLIDEGKKKVSEEKELFKKEEEVFRKRKEVVLSREKEIGYLLKGLDSKRSEIIPNIESIILKNYEKILNSKDGLAIVPVVGGACGGCHMNLPPQVVSEAKLKESIVICGSCTRILYVDDDVEIN
ncbi:MAG: C4-type zinc ribbon domain-containing protein [Candidatus Omnitrophota bacterium]